MGSAARLAGCAPQPTSSIAAAIRPSPRMTLPQPSMEGHVRLIPGGCQFPSGPARNRLPCAPVFRKQNMKVEKDKVVSFHYQLAEESGAEVENSNGREPMTFLFGHG